MGVVSLAGGRGGPWSSLASMAQGQSVDPPRSGGCHGARRGGPLEQSRDVQSFQGAGLARLVHGLRLSGSGHYPFLTCSSRGGLCADRREPRTRVPTSTHAASLWTGTGSPPPPPPRPTLLQGQDVGVLSVLSLCV